MTKSYHVQQLMDVLDLEDEEVKQCFSWLPHGRGFIITDKKRFAAEVLPKYFGESKYTSFTRRLNRWYFTIQAHGHKRASYYHPQFIRGDTKSCHEMIPAPQRKNSRAKKAIAAARARALAPPQTISIPSPLATELVSSNAAARLAARQQFSLSQPPLKSVSNFNSNVNVQRPDHSILSSNGPLTSHGMPGITYPSSSNIMGSQLFQAQYASSLQHVYAVHQAELARARLMSRHALERVMLESNQRFHSLRVAPRALSNIDALRLAAGQMKPDGVTSFSPL